MDAHLRLQRLTLVGASGASRPSLALPTGGGFAFPPPTSEYYRSFFFTTLSSCCRDPHFNTSEGAYCSACYRRAGDRDHLLMVVRREGTWRLLEPGHLADALALLLDPLAATLWLDPATRALCAAADQRLMAEDDSMVRAGE